MSATGTLSTGPPRSLWLFLRRLGWKTLAEILTRALSLIYFILLARLLGDTQYGLYVLPLAWTGLLVVALDWGGNTLILRELARHPERREVLWSAFLTAKLLATATFVLLLLGVAVLRPNRLSLAALLAAGLILLSQAWMDSLVAWLNARGDYALELRLRLLSRLLVLLPQGLVLWLHPDVLWLLWTAALTGLLSTGLAFRLAQVSPWQKPQRAELRSFLREGFGFWLANVSWLLYLKLDLLMLSLLGRPETELAWYQAGIRFYELLLLVAYLLSSVLFPILAGRQKAALAPAQIGASLLAMGCLGAALAGPGLVVVRPLLSCVLGASYDPTGAALSVLLLGIPYVFMSLFWFTLLGVRQQQHLVARAATVCLLVNLVLNLDWIPQHGYLGAAWATVVSDFLLWAVLTILALRTGLLRGWLLVLWTLAWGPAALLLWKLVRVQQFGAACLVLLALASLFATALWRQRRFLFAS